MSIGPAAEALPARKAAPRSAERRKKHGRTRVTNGSALLHGLADERIAWVRRARDVIAEFLSDFPEPTAGERLIIRRIATLVVVVEKFEADFANSDGNLGSCADSKPLDLYQRTVGNLRRLVESLGIKGRRAIDISPTLESIAAEIHAARPKGDVP
jgi:hypothetical protein